MGLQELENYQAILVSGLAGSCFFHCVWSDILSGAGFCCKALGHNSSHPKPPLSDLRALGLEAI